MASLSFALLQDLPCETQRGKPEFIITVKLLISEPVQTRAKVTWSKMTGTVWRSCFSWDWNKEKNKWWLSAQGRDHKISMFLNASLETDLNNQQIFVIINGAVDTELIKVAPARAGCQRAALKVTRIRLIVKMLHRNLVFCFCLYSNVTGDTNAHPKLQTISLMKPWKRTHWYCIMLHAAVIISYMQLHVHSKRRGLTSFVPWFPENFRIPGETLLRSAHVWADVIQRCRLHWFTGAFMNNPSGFKRGCPQESALFCWLFQADYSSKRETWSLNQIQSKQSIVNIE